VSALSLSGASGIFLNGQTHGSAPTEVGRAVPDTLQQLANGLSTIAAATGRPTTDPGNAGPTIKSRTVGRMGFQPVHLGMTGKMPVLPKP